MTRGSLQRNRRADWLQHRLHWNYQAGPRSVIMRKLPADTRAPVNSATSGLNDC
jgi:hypothetical protein